MKYILIYSYVDVFEKAECEFYLTRYEVPRQEVLVFPNRELLDIKVSELICKLLKNFMYSAYESKQIA